jgi:hypothetical protein
VVTACSDEELAQAKERTRRQISPYASTRSYHESWIHLLFNVETFTKKGTMVTSSLTR